MRSKSKNERVYPTSCLSLYCGKYGEGCEGCRFLPARREFEAWVKAHNAVVLDPVWSPTVYTAQDEPGERG